MAVIFTRTGSNGKGVLNKIMKEAFGDFHDEPRAALLTSKRPSDEKQNKKINGSFLKVITGEDTITVRTLNAREFQTYVPKFTPTFLCNVIPTIKEGSDDIKGIWRRLKIINFPVRFSATGPYDEYRKPIDDTLGTKVNAWAPELMLLLIEIFSEYCKNGSKLTVPEEVVGEQKMVMNSFLEFFNTM
ncbi:hypothetical protein BDK51DRAFT_48740 [Blyttiomyces helicus]|uniref:SF3 helicase domain-containing protein n=1 Tax=Blyttiomyces helicus TaxID=388810 RepID=A0A4P9WB60_9FUNG|nr:hypothetical protein BDK51DRAFT_48740 [Blyttiomyces helicus]|eukprot:RKO89714.1 hypothetical protein BDK51DRAFT_48740 [Blyttiomyces helicus]